MKVSLIVAASENDVIGKDGEIPWKLPDDLKRFRELTKGRTIIMGRKTFESIGRALPDRRNIVVTRRDMTFPGCDVAHSVEEAISVAGDRDVWVIGGGEIYKEAMPKADIIELTRVHTIIENGDAFFPKIDPNVWEEIVQKEHPTDASHAFAFTYHTYRRRRPHHDTD